MAEIETDTPAMSETAEAEKQQKEEDQQCVVCTSSAAKYRCPACDIRTCSLTCVKQHKQDKQCTGVRNKVAYIKTAKFTNMNLLSDYRLLEDTARTADNAVRDSQWKQRKTPHFLTKLLQKSKAFDIDLKLMPYPMTRRKTNRTRIYKMNSKDATIDWMVDWIFPHADMMTFTENVPFVSSMGEALMKHLHPSESEPVRRHALRRYVKAGMEGLALYMKAEGVPANEKRYHRLNPDATVTENLRAKLVVEYPSVYVVLRAEEEDSTHYKDNCLAGKSAPSCTSDSSESSEEEESEEEEETKVVKPEAIMGRAVGSQEQDSGKKELTIEDIIRKEQQENDD